MDKLRQAAEDALDSLEYIDSKFPDLTGWGTRGKRIAALREALSAPPDTRYQQAMEIISQAWLAVPEHIRMETARAAEEYNPLPPAVRALAAQVSVPIRWTADGVHGRPTETHNPQVGTWTLTAPDGRFWLGMTPLAAMRAEQSERIPRTARRAKGTKNANPT